MPKLERNKRVNEQITKNVPSRTRNHYPQLGGQQHESPWLAFLAIQPQVPLR